MFEWSVSGSVRSSNKQWLAWHGQPTLQCSIKSFICLFSVCGQYEFSCQSGDCIAVYDVCNGIAQCSDGSDEDPSVCPSNFFSKFD